MKTFSSENGPVTGELNLDTLALVQREAVRAHHKHGTGSILSGNRSPQYMLACAAEELGEVARALVDSESQERVVEELIQLANVALSAAQTIKKFGLDNCGKD